MDPLQASKPVLARSKSYSLVSQQMEHLPPINLSCRISGTFTDVRHSRHQGVVCRYRAAELCICEFSAMVPQKRTGPGPLSKVYV